MAKKVLIVLTSQSAMEADGEKKPTGWYLPELAHPYDAFKAAGYEVTIASPAGGVAPLDQSSVEAFKDDPSSASLLKNHKDLWEKTTKLSELKSADFDAIFYPGGHGPMFDLVSDKDSQRLIAEFYEAGKPTAAVCHGPVVFADVHLSSRAHLLTGKTVCGFTNQEEEFAGLVKFMPFLLEDKLKAVCGSYVKADQPYAEKVVVDGNLVTGQNPASAKGVGEAVVKLLG